MKDNDNLGMIILLVFVIITMAISGAKRMDNQAEQIKILEQSLQEQIQEKEVYMKMLEQKKEGEQKWEL